MVEPPYDYLLWRRNYVFRDQWGSYAMLVLLFYVLSERKLWIMVPITALILLLNGNGYYHLELLETSYGLYDRCVMSPQLIDYLLWRREYLFRDAWLSYGCLVALHYGVAKRKLWLVAPSLICCVALNVGGHLSLYRVEQACTLYGSERTLDYLLWRREYIFRDEWLSYVTLLSLYYVFQERRWIVLGPAVLCAVLFNSAAYHHLGLLEHAANLY